MGFVNPLSNLFQAAILRVLADWKVTGKENVPPVGPLIVVANHQSNFDPSLVSTSIPRRVSFLAKREVFVRGPADWFLRSYGAYPINRRGMDLGAYRWVISQLEQDKVVAIFPEGTRNRNGMRKANRGIAKIAVESQAAILPVGVSGTAHLGTVMRVFNPTGRIRVNIGTAYTLPAVEGNLNRAVLESLTESIMQRVAVLLPPELRGVYAVDAPAASEKV